jgi:L-lactate dehydrogenase complex protein LldG
MPMSDMSSRDRILNTIREKLHVRGDEAGRRGLVRSRIDRAPSGLIPARALEDRAKLNRRFIAMLEQQGAVVTRLKKHPELPDAVAAALREMNLPLELRLGDDAFFKSLPWDAAPFTLKHGPAEAGDTVSLSHAIVAAAETGTLFLTSGAANPSTLNFLPEIHMIVIAAEDILGSYEAAWGRIRYTSGRGKMPRTVNLISGPSRTADIEQTIIQGAHGPRRLFVFISGR